MSTLKLVVMARQLTRDNLQLLQEAPEEDELDLRLQGEHLTLGI